MQRGLSIPIAVLLLCAASARAEDEAPPAPPAARRLLLDEYFRGKITRFEKGEIEIRYDFSDARQLEDWVRFKPFRVGGDFETVALEGETLRLKGVGAMHHKATFQAKVSMEFDLTPWTDRDLGAVIAEDSVNDQYVLYSLNDIYFQRFDGVRTPQHMVTRFGVPDGAVRADEQVFRYVARGTEPAVKTMQRLHLRAEKEGPEDRFFIGDREYSGREPGRELTELKIGFYVVKANGVFDEVVLRGRLSPVWLEREKVEPALAAPVAVVPVGPSPEDKAAQALLDRFRAGTLPGEELLPVLGDAAVSAPLRQAACEALIAAGQKLLTAPALSLLYSEDVTSRRLGNDLVCALTGKNFGFDPRSPDDKRSRAIQRIVQFINKNPAEYGASR